MGSQLVKLYQNEVLVNLINVQDEPRMLNKGKTLGSVQPVGSVSLVTRDGENSVLEVQDTGASELDVGCQGSRANAPGAQSWVTHNSMASEPLDNEQTRSNSKVSVPGTSAFREIGVNGNSRASVLGTIAPSREPQISRLRGTASGARSSEVFMSNLNNTETSVTSMLSYSRPEMGVGVSLQVDTVRKLLAGTGRPRVSAWVTGDTPTGATPRVQLVDTPMRATPHAQPRPAQPSWMDWPDSTYPTGAIPTYPSYGTFTTLSATYVQSQNCQSDVGTWTSAAAGQSRDIMSVSTIAPVTLKGRDQTLQMLIGEINKQTRKLDALVKRRLLKSGNLASVVCYACRQEGHMARCCPQQGNWSANPVPQSNHTSAPGVVSITQTVSVTVQARTTTTRANGAVQQGVKTSAPQDSVSLSGWLLVIGVMFQWVVDIMN